MVSTQPGIPALGEGAMSLDTVAIWQEFSRRLRAFIAKRVSEPADADDILQTVFLRVHSNLGSLRQVDRLEPWLYRTTRNAIIDHHRARRPATLEESDEPAASDHDPHEEEAREELARCLMPMIQQLPELYREAVLLTDAEGATMPVAAQKLGLSVSGVKSRTQRGRARLREMFLTCCVVEIDARGRAIYAEPRVGCCDPSKGGCHD